MRIAALAPTPAPTDPYAQGFEAGLVEGYRAAVAGKAFPGSTEVSARRKFLAWMTLGLGLAGAAGAVLARKDKDLFVTFAVAGGVMTAILGATQVLIDDSARGPLGIR